ncbi:NAD(P)/FAD-dependent oxidoreductase [Nocardia sp. NPDC059177]|uniref:NAD(P)/FAD-dependent oxidoreductase n=1 Tax=Nocardia sp. NPDC059177 TaxID=3346759 RepID=UPI00367A9A0C
MNIVVIGAGYAGAVAANRLAKKAPGVALTVVNPRPDFIERVRLHEQLAGSGSAATPLAEVLAPGIDTRIAAVGKIGDGTLALDDGTELDFDHVIVAVGSTATPLPGTVPAGTWEGAEQARRALDELPANSSVTVIGGGLTGIETAAEIAEARPGLRVRLVSGEIGGSLSRGGQRKVRRGLARLGVDCVTEEVERVDGGRAYLRGGDVLETDLALWAVVSAVPELVARSGLAVDAQGRAVVDEFLRSVTDPRVLVAGDCAAVPGMRMACATANPQGAHAADTLLRTMAGRAPRPFSMGYAGQVLSVGRRDAVLQTTRRDDSPLPPAFTGRTAAAVKERIVRYAAYAARTGISVSLPGPR